MGAVDFGVIVDGGVVLVEAVARRLAAPDGPRPITLEERILQGVRSVVRPTVFSLLIIMAAYLIMISM